jgi:hypothetical protein
MKRAAAGFIFGCGARAAWTMTNCGSTLCFLPNHLTNDAV